MKNKVTVITATTGSPYLRKNLESVAAQTYGDVQHLVFVDGEHHMDKVKPQLDRINASVIVLPYATGIEQYNGHKMYAAGTYLAKGDYICYLDEDNWIDPNHVESLMAVADENSYACSLRKIVDSDGKYICNDDCESLGNWISVINDYFVDVNCFFFPKRLALQLTPLWYRRARHPDDQPEVDRLLTYTLRENKIECKVSGLYTVNYRAGNRSDSVQARFFLQGNEIMKQRYNGVLPWAK